MAATVPQSVDSPLDQVGGGLEERAEAWRCSELQSLIIYARFSGSRTFEKQPCDNAQQSWSAASALSGAKQHQPIKLEAR